MPLDPATAVPPGPRAVVRIVDEPTIALGYELPGHSDHITDVHGYAWRKVDVVDHLEMQPVLGDDFEMLVHGVGPTATEEMWLRCDGTGDDDVSDAAFCDRGRNHIIGISREE